MDAAQAGIREVGDLPSEDVGIEVEAVGDPVPTGSLGQADDAERERAPVLVVEVRVDQAGDRVGEERLDGVERVRKLGVESHAPTEQKGEGGAIRVDPAEVRSEAELDLLPRT